MVSRQHTVLGVAKVCCCAAPLSMGFLIVRERVVGNVQERIRIKQEARARVSALSFGDEVTNVCAGERNPLRHAFFVKNKGEVVQVTDKKGKFANFGCEVIYPGHLSAGRSDELFAPFWQAQFGEASVNGSER